MSNNQVTINSVEYVTHDALTFGDYGGYGSIGLANIRTIIDDQQGNGVEQISMNDIDNYQKGYKPYNHNDIMADFACYEEGGPAVLDAYGGYSARQVWVRKDIAESDIWGTTYKGFTSLIAALDEYPDLDEGKSCEVEMEWLDEAWELWLKHDLIATLPEWLCDIADFADSSDLFGAMHMAMELTNTYQTNEYSGCYVDVDRIADAFKNLVIGLLPDDLCDVDNYLCARERRMKPVYSDQPDKYFVKLGDVMVASSCLASGC